MDSGGGLARAESLQKCFYRGIEADFNDLIGDGGSLE